jgi:PqqD family protein of HPr-rel-A system
MTAYRISDGVLRAELDGEAVLMNPESGQYHLLNATGVRVLDSIEHEGDVAQLIAVLASEGGPSVSKVSADVHAFITALLERQLIVEMDR